MAFLDVGFEWPVDAAGYEAVEVEPKPGPTVAQSEYGGTDIVRRGGALNKAQPFQYHRSLFLQFGRLDGSPAQCVEFASRFGLLWDDGTGEGREDLEFWRGAIKNMRALIEARRRDGDSFSLPPLERIAQLDAYLVPEPPDGKLALRMKPTSLLGGMYLQFAQAAVSGKLIKTCDHCGAWFESGLGTGRRLDARFCTSKCQVDANNARARKRRVS